MTLPTLIEYDAPVPPRAELPESRAGWVLDVDRAAVLVHDLQEYFLRPYGPACGAIRAAVENTAAILRAARAAGVPVFYTAQTGDQALEQRGLQADLWGPGMKAVPEHTRIVDQVAPAPGETVLVKHRYSAFQQSDLRERLRSRGRDQLVVTGVYAHIGIAATAFDGFMQEVHPFVVADAVADFGPEQHALALAQVASCSGVVTTAGDVVAAFTPTGTTGVVAEEGEDTAHVALLREALAEGVDAEFAAAALGAPERDLFEMGLNSLRAFEVLDVLAEHGVDVDFGAFTRRPTVEHLLSEVAAAGLVSAR